jgi:hypothetical protein
MPRGVVLWFDAGEGEIRRDGREYPVAARDIEPAARVPRARVHFDIRREDGVKRAVNVTLQEGARVSPGQHRFGDLAGAHHPDEKGHHPLSDDHPGTDPSYEGHPMDLIREWVRLANIGELSTLALLYAPEAGLHIGSEHVMGRSDVVERLSRLFEGDHPQAKSFHGHDDFIEVELDLEDRILQARFAVAHGQVVEQWVTTVRRRPSVRS